MMTAGWAGARTMLAGSVLAAACTAAAVPGSSRPLALETSVVVREHPLTLHLSLTPKHPVDPLVLYTTGDGGWRGGDKDLFDRLVAWGYPVAGFSARDYLNHLGEDVETITSEAMAADFAALIRAAKAALNLPVATRVVLVGKSRGAGMDVAVGSQESIRARLRGVIAIALTREEEYVADAPAAGGPAAMLLTYSALPGLGRTPVAIIQSTHDDYLPAAEARTLFGPDTPSRTLRPIESSDHNFDGGEAALYRELTSCFDWILRQ